MDTKSRDAMAGKFQNRKNVRYEVWQGHRRHVSVCVYSYMIWGDSGVGSVGKSVFVLSYLFAFESARAFVCMYVCDLR